MKKLLARSQRIKVWRDRMLLEDPHCYWCKREVIYFYIEGGGKVPDNFATYDHIYDRVTHKEERTKLKGEGSAVLACAKCNMERGRLLANPITD